MASLSRAGGDFERDAERRGLARGGALSFAGSASSAILGFLLVLVAARLLGEAGAGVLLQLVGIFSITAVLGKAGLDSAALWLLPRLVDEGSPQARAHVLYIMATATITGVLAGLAVGLGLPWVLSTTEEQNAVGDALAMVAWFIPFGVLVLVAMAVTRALGAIVPFVLYGNVGLPLLRLVAVILAGTVGASASIVALAWAAPLVPILVVLLCVTWRRLQSADRSSRHTGHLQGDGAQSGRWPAKSDRRKIVRFSAPRTLSAGLEQLLVWLHVLLVGALMGPAAAGIYGSATRFIAAGLIVDTALRIVVSPRFSLLIHRRNIHGAQDLYRTATRWLVLFATPGFVLLTIFAPTVLGWLGPGFVEGTTALVFMCAGAMVTFLAGNTHSVLLMSGHAVWAAVNKLVAVAITLFGCLMLIPSLGLTGGAVAWSAAIFVDAALAALEVKLLVGITPEVPTALSSLGLSALAVGVPAAIARFTLGSTNLALIVGVVAGGAVFVVAAFLLRDRLQLSGLRAGA